MSFCAVRPRQLDELCDEALEVLIDIITAIERGASWHLMTTKIGFVQKRLGGARPIAGTTTARHHTQVGRGE
eukprot:9394681-Pyramimonas_sp.AAC.1